MRGREHPIVLPDALHALLAQCSPSIAVYVSAPPTARHIPLASVMGIEPISRWVWRPDRPPGRTPYDSFPDYRLVKSDQGRTDALCRLGTSGSRGARPEPSLNAGVITRVLCTWGSFHYPDKCRRRVEKTSPRLAQFRYNQGSSRCPGISCIWR